MKEPKTYDEQVEIIKNKGFIVNDSEKCIKFLQQANFYRLSAYFLPFKKKDGTYVSNINFDTIQRIYEFDSKLRSIIFKCIEKIELYIRTQLAYYSGHVHGSLGYMDPTIYNAKHNDEKFKKLIKNCIDDNKRTLVVRHHKEKYNGEFPIWVMIEFFSMGMLSYFYADLQTGDQKKIAKNTYATSVACLKSWLRCITDLRNRCAHYSRLYAWPFPALPKIPRNIDFNANRQLFSQILVLKLLYPDGKRWKSEVLTELSALIEEYKYDISLERIGFPENWDQLLRV